MIQTRSPRDQHSIASLICDTVLIQGKLFMVNFSEKLESGRRAEWAVYYVDYSRMKKLIDLVSGKIPSAQAQRTLQALLKKLCTDGLEVGLPSDLPSRADSPDMTPAPPGSGSTSPGSQRPSLMATLSPGANSPLRSLSPADSLCAPLLSNVFTEEKGPFLKALRAQRGRVQGHYERESQRCREKIEHLLEGLAKKVGKSVEGGSLPLKTHASAVTESSLTRASTDVYRTLQHLRNFCILNYTGLLKVAKKHDKAVQSDRRVLAAWKPELDETPFVKSAEIDVLCAQLEAAYAAAFYDGSIMSARATLLVRKDRASYWVIADLGIRGGFALTLVAWLIWDLTLDPTFLHLPKTLYPRDIWIKTQLPVYRASLALVVAHYVWAGVLYMWTKNRINFEYMFELDNKSKLSAMGAASSATRLAALLLLSLLLFSKALLGELPASISPGVFPVALFVAHALMMLLPRGHAARLCSSLGHVLAAPFFAVDLWSVFVADVLTSLVRPLTDLVYSCCYVITLEWQKPYAKQGSCADSPLFNDLAVPLLCALPMWCRFLQCMRIYNDTKKRNPALPNALKYSVGMLVVLFGSLHPTLVASATSTPVRLWIQLLWFSIYLAGTLYTFSWDVIMDWKLGHCAHGGLRQRRMLQTWFYYAAIAADFVFRFGWTATIVPHWFSVFGGGGKHEGHGGTPEQIQQLLTCIVPLISSCEIARRGMWAILRLEAEHLHNTEGFRRVDVVPLHFDRSPSRLAAADDEGREQRATVLVEMLGFTGVVTSLALFSALSKEWTGWDSGDGASWPPSPAPPHHHHHHHHHLAERGGARSGGEDGGV